MELNLKSLHVFRPDPFPGPLPRLRRVGPDTRGWLCTHIRSVTAVLCRHRCACVPRLHDKVAADQSRGMAWGMTENKISLSGPQEKDQLGSSQSDFSGAQPWGQAPVTPSNLTPATSLSRGPGRAEPLNHTQWPHPPLSADVGPSS